MIPILLFLIFGFMLLALTLFSYVTTYAAAREGASYVVQDPVNRTDTLVKNQICTTSPGLGGTQTGCQNALSDGSLVVTVDPSCTSAPCSDGRGPLHLMTITVKYRVPIPTLSLSLGSGLTATLLGPIWVQSRSIMAIEQ